jgi:N-acetyl-D-muramate 6-phosphate phosphatase
MLPPRALLLDFGGVIAETAPDKDTDDPAIYDRVHTVIRGALPVERIRAAMAAADEARDEWRSDPAHPELTHAQLWGAYVARGWPVPAQAAVVEHCAELTAMWATRKWSVIDGIPELLEYTLGRGIPVAVVSNTKSGRAHREFLERSGLTPALAAQFYSDELGIFKPNPEMLLTAARFLDEPIGRCWFVGDSIGRDVACGRAAGIGAMILRPSSYWSSEEKASADADAIAADGHEILKLLKTAS